MQAILKVISEPGAGRMTVIRQGQVLQVGRTSWSDFTIADDDSMGDVHFSLEVTFDECVLRHLAEGLETQINGEPAAEADIADGDRITAGRTVFAVTLQGAPRPTAENNGDAPAGEEITSGYKYVETPLARDVTQKYDLDDDVLPLLAADTTAREFVDRLVEKSRFDDGIVFLAAAIPKREAVWWGCQCCCGDDSSSLPPDDQKAIEAAKQWVIDPSEENRRAAEDAAKAGQLLTAPSCVAMAVFLSGGSIGPPDAPDIPPADHLTGHTVGCAVKFAATSGDPMKINESKKRLLELGIKVADGENRWQE